METNELNYSWTFWVDKPDLTISDENWEQFLIKIERFDSVEKFWSIFNNFLLPSEFQVGMNIHLFKSNIEPKWEDVNNLKGGKWMITIPKQTDSSINKLWEKTVVTLICGTKSESIVENINGVVLSVRKNLIKISLWTKGYFNKSIQLKIGKFWKKIIKDIYLLQNMILEYFPHISLLNN